MTYGMLAPHRPHARQNDSNICKSAFAPQTKSPHPFGGTICLNSSIMAPTPLDRHFFADCLVDCTRIQATKAGANRCSIPFLPDRTGTVILKKLTDCPAAFVAHAAVSKVDKSLASVP